MQAQQQQKTYVRFSVDQRIEHVVLIFSFFVLALTGLPQKFPLWPISDFILRVLGGIETVRFIHRFSAFVMMIQSLFHVLSIAYRLFVNRSRAAMLPTTEDIFDAFKQLGYNLGLVKRPPKMDRFNFAEKAEYWALVWGTLIMGITGFMLWNPIATTRILPGQIIPAAKAAHGAEAVLAVLAILLWHFYHVHLKRWNWSIFTGRITRHEMEEEHAAELERIESGVQPAPVRPEVRERRQMLFFPAAALFTLGFLFLVFFFTNYEETAITTLPPEQRSGEAFSPQTRTPFSTPTFLPTQPQPAGEQAGELTWEGQVSGLLQAKCGSCHGQMGGFSVESLETVLQGGASGPAVVPGEPEEGVLVARMEAGDHPVMLTPDELALVKEWIATGAPAGEAGSTAPAEELSLLTWDDGIGQLFQDTCARCHGQGGGLSVESYTDLLAGGSNEKAVVPGEPDESLVVQLMTSGSHFAKFSDDQLAWIVAWIQNGAPER